MNCTLFKRYKVIHIFAFSHILSYSNIRSHSHSHSPQNNIAAAKNGTQSRRVASGKKEIQQQKCALKGIFEGLSVCPSVCLCRPFRPSVRPSDHPLDLFGLYCSSKCRIVPFVRLRLLAEQNEWGR